MRTDRDPAKGTRIAIAHDYLTQRGGAERVVLTLARAFPEAPIYTTFYSPDSTFPEFKQLDVRAARVNRCRFLRQDHRKALPILAPVSTGIRVDADVVIASSSGWAHGFGGHHSTLVYCYSPARWLYQRNIYLPASGASLKRLALFILSPALRRWDKRAARHADQYLAISSIVRERIAAAYGIDSPVVPAPLPTTLLEVPAETVSDPIVQRGNYYLCVSRLLPYKNVDVIISAMRLLPEHRLVIIGDGPDRNRLRNAAPPNVSFLQNLTDGQMRTAYENSAGLVAASYEDFGLTPLEAALFGKPSAVLAAGGFLDTMKEGITGVFFSAVDDQSIAAAVTQLAERDWNASAIREHASTFNEDAFIDAIHRYVSKLTSAV